jgi:hypothetical protein
MEGTRKDVWRGQEMITVWRKNKKSWGIGMKTLAMTFNVLTYAEVAAEQRTIQRGVAIPFERKVGITAVLEQELCYLWSVVFCCSIKRRRALHAVCLLNAVFQKSLNRLGGGERGGRGEKVSAREIAKEMEETEREQKRTRHLDGSCADNPGAPPQCVHSRRRHGERWRRCLAQTRPCWGLVF